MRDHGRAVSKHRVRLSPGGLLPFALLFLVVSLFFLVDFLYLLLLYLPILHLPCLHLL